MAIARKETSQHIKSIPAPCKINRALFAAVLKANTFFHSIHTSWVPHLWHCLSTSLQLYLNPLHFPKRAVPRTAYNILVVRKQYFICSSRYFFLCSISLLIKPNIQFSNNHIRHVSFHFCTKNVHVTADLIFLNPFHSPFTESVLFSSGK